MKIKIDAAGGKVTFLYEEELGLWDKLKGVKTITRASHVEPDLKGDWWASMVKGPVLGPFATRGEALRAEVRWLEENLL